MPIDDIPLSLASLPAILAGPILRRLTRTSVCVWVALSNQTALKLHIARNGQETVSPDFKPVKVGTSLWLAALTGSSPDADGTFAAGAFYTYHLSSDGWPAPDWSSFAFDGGNEPGFPGLADNVQNLTILHVSCRKWAGGGGDALALAADVIEDRIKKATPNPRPHLLIHSGDQIYADDVATPLAPRIRRVASDLVGIDQEETDLFPDEPMWGGRQGHCEDFGLTSTCARDHLWFLGEFYAAYLLAWSEVLWPATIPTYDQVKFDLHSESGIPDETAWNELRARVQLFRDGVPKVRKVLANVPSLMLLDDHEVTDDWNINWDWLDAVYDDDCGRRVIANAMLAFNLFQHWGNVPDRYATAGTTENAILTAATFPGPADEAAQLALETKMGLPPEVPLEPPDPDDLPPHPLPPVLRDRNAPGAIAYDFIVGPAEGYPIRTLFLDERTVREYFDTGRPAARIALAALPAMVPDPTVPAPPVTIVVAPSPLFGTHVIEHVLQPASSIVAAGALYTDFESWSQQPEHHQELLARLAKLGPIVVFSGDVHYGAVSKASFTKGGVTTRFCQFVCSAAKNSDALTMTVHQLSDLATLIGIERPRRFSVYQSTVDSDFLKKFKDLPPLPASLPWDDIADLAFGRIRAATLARPVVLSAEVAEAYEIGAPDWKFEFGPVDDQSMPPAAEALVMNNAPGPWTGWVPANSFAMVTALRARDLHRSGRVMVGLPQIAIIQFATSPQLAVEQHLFCHVGEQATTSVPLVVNTRVPLA